MGDDAIRLYARTVGLSPEVSGHANVQDAIAAGGGGGAGNVIVRKFPFAFNTPSILTGATLYTPTVGDVLLNAWIEIVTVWNGTTPQADIGTFVGVSFGLFGENNKALPLDAAVDSDGAGTGVLIQGSNYTTGGLTDLATNNIEIASAVNSARIAPAKFTAANPMKVCVSQDGTNTGADPGSTTGAGVVYLVTCTPT